MEVVKLTREELYERVWAEPMRTLAQHYGLSDVGLAKTCKRLRVPVPGRGYWAKKAAGYVVKRKALRPLPADSRPADREITLGYSPIPIEKPSLPLIVRSQLTFETAPENRIVVSDNLRSAHPHVRKTSQALRGTAKSETDFAHNYQEPHLDIQVSRDLLSRAFHVMDALVKACEERDWKISLGSKGDARDRKSYVTLFNTTVPFGIRERIKKLENPPAKPVRMAGGGMYTPWQSKYKDVPSGRLSLVLRSRWGDSVEKSLDDTPSQRVEDRLNEFMVAVVARAYEDLEWDAGRENNERDRHAEEVRRWELAKRREEELARIRALEDDAANWDKSERIQAYVAAVRSAASTRVGNGPLPTELASWLAWAQAHASSLNPLCREEKKETPAERRSLLGVGSGANSRRYVSRSEQSDNT